jgi:phosphoglycolate phosphatase
VSFCANAETAQINNTDAVFIAPPSIRVRLHCRTRCDAHKRFIAPLKAGVRIRRGVALTHSYSEGMPAAHAVVLFDIDGTLLSRAGPHHKQALVDAIQSVTGLETDFGDMPTSGRLDRDLIRGLLRQSGARLRDIERWMPAIIDRAQSGYELSCPQLEDRVCPGVLDLLQRLEQASIPAGLVTGNLSAIGWKKMEAAGLRRHFSLGAFSEMARTRAGLARKAMQQARRTGIAGRDTAFSLVGDHPNDVEAAKLNGIRSIAVATGVSTLEELAACNPDMLVPDLRALQVESLL